MTAKEMLKKSILITDNVNGTGYFFTETRLKDFLSQYSKEQRENCAKEAMVKEIGSQFTEIVADEDSILNAKQPEV